MLSYLYPLFLTLLIETPIYFYFLFKNNGFKNFILITLINIFSNTLFNYGYINSNYSQGYLIGFEIIVYIFESLITYRIYKMKKSFIISFFANLISLVIGLILNLILDTFSLDLLLITLIIEILYLIYLGYFLVYMLIKYIKNKLGS